MRDEIQARIDKALEFIFSVLDHIDAPDRRRLAASSDVEEWLLLGLAMDEDPEVRRNTAGNEKLDPLVQKALSKDSHYLVRSAIARNSWTSPDILEELSHDRNNDVRYEVATNANTPPATLTRMVKEDTDEDVKYALGENPALPLALMRKLVDSKSYDFFAGLAENPSTPPELLAELAEYGYEYDWGSIHTFLAVNPNTPDEALSKIMEDTDDEYLLSRVSEHKNASDLTQFRCICRLVAKPGGRGFYSSAHSTRAKGLTLLALLAEAPQETKNIVLARDDLNEKVTPFLNEYAEFLWGEDMRGIPANWLVKMISIGTLKFP